MSAFCTLLTSAYDAGLCVYVRMISCPHTRLLCLPLSFSLFGPVCFFGHSHERNSGPSVYWKFQPKTRLKGFPHLAAHVWNTCLLENVFAVAVVWSDQPPVGRIKDAVTENSCSLRGHTTSLCCLETPLVSDSAGRNIMPSVSGNIKESEAFSFVLPVSGLISERHGKRQQKAFKG